MKINSVANVIPLTTSLRTQSNEGDGGASRQQYDPHQSRRDGQGKEQPKKFDQAVVDEAVKDFASDAAAQASGLSVTLEGVGPGLRVLVKDASGTTLRQFSSDQFLRLREGHSPKDARSRGKILDQKV